jgi:uncharacterized protein with PQ loop repeat
MLPRIAADFLVLLHFSFIVFVLLGGLLVLKWRWLAYLHLPCAFWGILIEFFGWICPLTPLENHFREKAGQTGYSGGFMEHYLLPLIYPVNLTHNLQIILGLLVLTVNLAIYGLVLFKHYQRKG